MLLIYYMFSQIGNNLFLENIELQTLLNETYNLILILTENEIQTLLTLCIVTPVLVCSFLEFDYWTLVRLFT